MLKKLLVFAQIRTWDQYESAKKFLKRIPSSLKVIIDHLGKPNAKTGAEPEWYEDIKILAGYPNVYCKLSGNEAHLHCNLTSTQIQYCIPT